MPGQGDRAYKDAAAPGWEVKDAGKPIPKQLLRGELEKRLERLQKMSLELQILWFFKGESRD